MDVQAINARRAWIIDQLAALIRNGAIPKSDDWVQSILDWFVVHGIFLVKKKSIKSPIRAVRSICMSSYVGNVLSPSLGTCGPETCLFG